LENSRVEQHLSFILKNISFGTPSGRISVLSTLDTLICKFPQQIVDLYGELLFFTLLLRTVNEDDQNCRLKVFEMIKTLLESGKISGDKLKVFFHSIFKLGNDKL
jgi:U3 small nucleolar RNA-associated protein 20